MSFKNSDIHKAVTTFFSKFKSYPILVEGDKRVVPEKGVYGYITLKIRSRDQLHYGTMYILLNMRDVEDEWKPSDDLYLYLEQNLFQIPLYYNEASVPVQWLKLSNISQSPITDRDASLRVQQVILTIQQF